MAIGEVASRFGLAPHVLRHWEAMGLLAPVRAEGERRRYNRDDLYRIAVILRAREAGIGLEDLREMLTATDPAVRREILRRHRENLARRIAQAQASLELIDCALDCDHEDFTSCSSFGRCSPSVSGRSRLKLRAMPPASPARVELDIVGEPARTLPGWDGNVHPALVVRRPAGSVLSVPPELADAMAGLNAKELAARVAALVGYPERDWFTAVYRWSDQPAPLPDAGLLVPAADPDVPDWLRPFGGEVIVPRNPADGIHTWRVSGSSGTTHTGTSSRW